MGRSCKGSYMTTRYTKGKIAAAATLLLFLSACGGGGSSSTSSTVASTYSHTSSNANRLKTTVTHALNAEATVSDISYVEETNSFSYGNSLDLSLYVLDNGTNTFTVSSSGVSSTNLVTLTANAGNQEVLLGGSTWASSRYGLFIDKTPNSNGLNTQYVVRHMPYIRYLRYFSADFSDATYNQAGSKAVGGLATTSTRWATVTCNVSAAASSTGGGATSVDITLSGCDNGIATTGYLRLSKATVTGTASASMGTFTITNNGNTFTPTLVSGYYGFGGTNSEELVGHFELIGNTTVSGVSKSTQFTVAFGAHK